jgi:hypothetical protein
MMAGGDPGDREWPPRHFGAEEYDERLKRRLAGTAGETRAWTASQIPKTTTAAPITTIRL